MKHHRNISWGTDLFSSKSVFFNRYFIDILWIFYVKVFLGRSKYFYCISCKTRGKTKKLSGAQTLLQLFISIFTSRKPAIFIFHVSRIWEHFLYTLSLVTKSRSRYRKLTSPRPSCLCSYSISWLDSAYMAQNRVPHCETISTLRIIYCQSSPEIWPLKIPATLLWLILTSEEEQ